MLSKKQIKNIEENTVFSVQDVEDGYEISYYTPAGEDYSFYVGKKNAKEDIISYCDDFDIEEHVALWFGANRGEPGILELVDDAKHIDECLQTLKEVMETC